MPNTLRTPLAKVRGLGAAREGTEHHVSERVGWIALLILAPYCLISFLILGDYSYPGVREWIAKPWNALPLALLVFVGFQNLALMIRVVIEDYIHGRFSRSALLILNTFAAIALSVTGVWGVFVAALGR